MIMGMRNKKKRMLSVILMAALIMGLMPVNTTGKVAAATGDYLDVGQCGANLTYVLDANGVLSITGEGEMNRFADAASVPWFKYRSLITTVSFQGDITGIGAHAFEYCVQLSSVSLPDALTGIAVYSFYQCTSLSSISIPEGVTSIGAGAFAGCSGMDTITVPDSVTSIGEGAFENTGIDDSEIAYRRGSCGDHMTWKLLGGRTLYLSGTGAMTDYTRDSVPWYDDYKKITKVVVEEGVTRIGNHAFEGCEVISSFLCPDSVTAIGSYAFAGCPGLTEITINPNVKEIGEQAFSGCVNLKKAAMKKMPDIMGGNLFADCSALCEVELPDDCTELSDYMFDGCTALGDGFRFPGELKKIGAYTFFRCSGFTEVTVPDSVREIGEGAFAGCRNLKRVDLPFAGGSAEAEEASAETLFGYIFGKKSYSGGTAVKQYYSESGSASYYIPDTLTEVSIRGGRIWNGTFDHCAGLENITIPDGMTEIPDYLYRGCVALKINEVPEETTAIGDYAYSGTSLRKAVLTDRVQKIGKGAFSECSMLESAELPGNVTEIPESLFRGCEKLEHITMAKGVERVGDYAYAGCAAVEELALPDTLLYIGRGSFKSCTGIQSVIVPERVTEIGEGAFAGCSSIKDIRIPFAGTKAGAEEASRETLFGILFGTEAYPGGTAIRQEYSISGSATFYIPDTLTNVTVTGGNLLYGAFSGCSGIKVLSIPDKMTVLGPKAFSGCQSLTALRLPDGIKELGDYVLDDCNGLTELVIPEDVNRIGNYALRGCSSLSTVSMPDDITAIGERAFENCAKIGKLSLPAKLTSIGSGAFANCTGLTRMEVPDTVTEMGEAAFSGCSGFTSMRLPFIGGNSSAVTASASTVFGYIFGTVNYEGSTPVKQKYTGSGSKTYYIPSSLKRVEVTGGRFLHGAFSECSSLTYISVPEGITEIGNYAFSGCSGLTSLLIPADVLSIGSYAFKDCTGIDKITLPDRLGTIGSYAFQNCTGLTGMTVPDSVTDIGSGAFSGCSGLKSIRLPFVGNSRSLASASSKTLFGYIFGPTSYTGGLKTQQYYSGSYSTFYIPSALKNVEITGGELFYGAFYNCAGLTDLSLPDNLTVIPKNAFFNCSGLSQMTVPSKVSEIMSGAFSGCTGMKSITFSGSAPVIDSSAFKKAVASVYYPTGDPSWADCAGSQYGGTLTWQKHDHQYILSEVAPTCTESGYTLHKCAACGSFYQSDYIDALGHTPVADPAVEATCTKEGLTAGSHCSVCGEIIEKQEVVKTLEHIFDNYVSNGDATYDADGTKTAVCGYGCGTKNTITDTGSRLTDKNKPEITITMGPYMWQGLAESAEFGLFFKEIQNVAVSVVDDEPMPDGSSVSRVDCVYYYISDKPVADREMERLSWSEYRTALSLADDGRYVIYVKAVDKSGNVSYASTAGFIIDNGLPIISGIKNGDICCGGAEFVVSDLSPCTVTDNGVKRTPEAASGKYTIAGDGKEHVIRVKDSCGNSETVHIMIYEKHTWEEESWKGPLFQWAEDSKSCQALFTCTHETGHSQTIDCIVSADSDDADCTTPGKVTYTAAVVSDGREWTDERTVSGVPIGHDYAAVFYWSGEFDSCEADLVCRRPGCTEDTEGHSIRGGKCTIEKKVTEATCVQEGRQEMIASILIDGCRYTDTGRSEVTGTNPERHINTRRVHVSEPTCQKEGYTGDLYCDDCKKTVQEGAVRERLAHQWDRGTVTKEPAGSIDGIRTYQCLVCGTQKNEVIPASGGTEPEPTDQPGPTEEPKPTGDPLPTEKPGATEDPLPADTPKPSGDPAPTEKPVQPYVTVPADLPEVGTVVRDTAGQGVYTVTESGASGGTVTLTGISQNKALVQIPDKITVGKRTYRVTAIAARAFKGNKKLKRVTIGKNIKKIGKQAFYGCKGLKKVIIRTTKLTAKGIGKQAFKKINSRAVFKVPAKKLRLYKKVLRKRGVTGRRQKIRK